ncbi:hypothetical protein PY254_12770 [Rhodanobacter sp. AS-Z3]|uniref:hypothetical protein n=1 Tax=Rhodanobacter sp. AS-Z3 TaxID=3031330 RepID=UPI00247ACB25|nr:hypothetical protein [Rhodanobacter sp. AS-Z3]WEN14106.1 hypothetical protein PY254_12770 [Rhodanobacter sp. AS-Z3]
MAFKASFLTLSLALALGSSVFAAELPSAIEFPAGVHQFEIDRITKGKFVRVADGTHAATVVMTGQHGLVINGGHFSTAKPVNYARGIELARGKSISLYNKEKPTQQPGSPEASYNLYTADEIKSIFASGDKERINNAFTSSDANKMAPVQLTEANALAALAAANEVAAAREKTAWKLTSSSGNLEVNSGNFNFHSVNQNIISADAGQLIWNGGELVSSGGGGDTILQGSSGIDILGGNITSNGTVDGKPTAVQYDDRHKLNRDRWTLGKYLSLASNGDINVGLQGQPGPVIHVSDGMLKIGVVSAAPAGNASAQAHYFNLNSGSVTLQGDYRSTLLALERTYDLVATIKGGVLNISTGEKLAHTPTESPSMWNMKTLLEGGVINLVNGEVIGPNSAIRGGLLNMMGRSSFSSPMGSLTISGGTINVGPQSFIGAIRGDSKAQSTYPTSQQDLTISGGTLKFKVAAPAHGSELKVGTDIGGIFAGDNNPARPSQPTLTIAPETVIKLDTSALNKGTYTAANFASVDEGDGSLHIAAPMQIGGPELPYSGTLDTSGLLTIMVH